MHKFQFTVVFTHPGYISNVMVCVNFCMKKTFIKDTLQLMEKNMFFFTTLKKTNFNFI